MARRSSGPAAAVVVVVLALGVLAVVLLRWGGDRPGPSAAPGAAASPTVAQVVRVADGDTLDVVVAGQRQRVRLLGIDAPEVAHDGQPAQCGADEATAALRALVASGPVQVVPDPAADQRDRFGRLLAYVEVGGVDVGRALVEQGRVAAWTPASAPRPSRFGAYLDAARTAREGRVGSWATCDRLGR